MKDVYKLAHDVLCAQVMVVCMSCVLSVILTPPPPYQPFPRQPFLLLPSSPAPVWCGLSDDVQHLLHLYAHPGLQSFRTAHFHWDAPGKCYPLQVNWVIKVDVLVMFCPFITNPTVMEIGRFFSYVLNLDWTGFLCLRNTSLSFKNW